ncbi:MAG TPA: glycoside hydrolase family 172 protein, partial [Planctomycetota bacterium]|nr:glycoside hydrolase family 172 protein [Planctomycetota bacterium]
MKTTATHQDEPAHAADRRAGRRRQLARRQTLLVPSLAAIACSVGLVRAQAPVFEYSQLLRRLVEVDWLWQPPLPGERCVQWSSYDRASHKGPADHAAWYANDDRGQHLRVVEKDGSKQFVMVDAKGPGCVARIWSANPSGTLHFDIDGARTWSVEFAALCSGKLEGVPAPLAGMRSRGGNCYLPIPFAKSLVVSCTAGDCYYTFDVVQWPAGTLVEAFAPATLAASTAGAGLVDATARIGPYNTEHWVPARKKPVEKGQVVVKIVVELPESVPRADQVEILRNCLLVVRCGDEETVRVPVADFFALGSVASPYASRCLAVTKDRAICTFPMPMPDGGSVEIVAERDYGAMTPQLDRVQTRPLQAPDALRFRASYHVAKGTPTRPFGDHLVLDAKGRGRFVGCSLLVRNPSQVWWGEGDEKFTVDGEAFPSWFGTGTEDYFGYAWCDPTPFQAPFHAQIECQGPRNFGLTQLHRTHVLDSVPFQQSFRFDLERWHWIDHIAVDYATVAYWYGAPGATSGLPPVPAAAERAIERPAPPRVFVAEGVLEGEDLRVVACPSGTH